MPDIDVDATTDLPGPVVVAMEVLYWSGWIEGVGQTVGDNHRELSPLESACHDEAVQTLRRYMAGKLETRTGGGRNPEENPTEDDGPQAGTSETKPQGRHARSAGGYPPADS